MSETAWTEEAALPPKKRGLPTWAWFCGGGCLLLIVLGVVAAGLGVNYFKKGRDAEVQWPRLAEILPVDESHEHLKLMFGNQIGIEQYTLADDRGYTLQFQHHTGSRGEEARRKLFESDKPELPSGSFGLIKFEGTAKGSVEVQGRDVEIVRMRMELGGFAKDAVEKKGESANTAMAFLDLTPPGEQGLVLLQLMRQRGGDPITDEEVREVLVPFHVGPKR